MLRRFSVNFAIFSLLLDGLVAFASIQLMSIVRIWLNRFSFIAPIQNQVIFPGWLNFVFPLVWVAVLSSFSIYDSKKFLKVVDELSTLTIASFIASISQAGILYLTYRDFSRALFLLIVLFSYLMCVLLRVIYRVVFRMRKETLNTGQRILIVGAGPELKKIEKIISKNLLEKIENCTILDLKAEPCFSSEIPETCPQTVNRVREEINKIRASDVIIAFSRNATNWTGAISSDLESLPLGVWVALDYFDLSLANTYVENLGGIPILDLRAPALDDYSRILKRIFDLIGSVLVLIITSPLLFLTGLIVLIDSGWPVFFLQKRVGENGRLFTMIKFRTMVKNAESLSVEVEQVSENGAVIHKTRNDPRITRSGKFLRRFSLDELPQFINVLKGEMSIVGPRPELQRLAENYEHWQRQRLTVPPGITGWWQVHGRSDRVMHLHTEDDIYYVENYSIWLDFRIIIRTIWVVLIGRGAF